MAHGDLAQTAALLGAGGSVLVLVPRARAALVTGFVMLAAAEACLAVALVPRTDLSRLDRPLRLAALAAVALAVTGLGAALARYPAAVPVVLLLAAPFRLPVDLGSQHAFLLLPLYGVLAASSLALLFRAWREPVPALPPLLALPAAAFIAFDAVSLLWAQDLQEGSIELAFFIFPFSALVAVVARSPVAPWLARALGATLVSLACVFSAVGLWQEWTRRIFFAHDLRVANTYASFFRVTSVFKDPSIYGRHLVLAIVVLLVLLWLGRVGFALTAGLVALLFAGLYFSYSQSSMAVLFVGAAAVTLVLGDARTKRIIAVAAVITALAGGAMAATTARGHSLRKATSGRSRLVTLTTRVIRHHPLFGVGVGSQPLASQTEAKTKLSARKDASHTTPLTVAAELGVVGVLLYLGLLAGGVRLLMQAARRDRALGLGLAAAFLVLLLHSLFYSGFFEDPIMWGSLATAAALLAVPAASRTAQPVPEVVQQPGDDGKLGGAAEVDHAGGEDLRTRLRRVVRHLGGAPRAEDVGNTRQDDGVPR
jgi:putative inorganic carbon (HCO3(-)) transporter